MICFDPVIDNCIFVFCFFVVFLVLCYSLVKGIIIFLVDSYDGIFMLFFGVVLYRELYSEIVDVVFLCSIIGEIHAMVLLMLHFRIELNT